MRVSSKPVQPWGTKAVVLRLPIQHRDAGVQMLGPASIAITWGQSDTSCEVLLMSPGFFLGW